MEKWVELVVGLRPQLSPAEARLLVHAVLNLVTDLGASVQAPPIRGFEQPVIQLVSSVLRLS